MKKLIIISLIIAIILGFGVSENIVTVKTYKELIEHCDNMEIALELSDEKISNNNNVTEIFKKIEIKWKDFQGFSLAFANHNTIKDFSQKLNMLKGYLYEDDKKEVIVCLNMLRSSAQFIIEEFAINYANIL